MATQKDSRNTLFADDKVFVMLDIDWVVKGHTLVIWKEHHENASELREEEFKHFASIYWRVEKTLLEVLNVPVAVTLKSGGLVSHFHFHIYPLTNKPAGQGMADILDKLINKTMKYEPEANEAEEFAGQFKNRLSKDL